MSFVYWQHLFKHFGSCGPSQLGQKTFTIFQHKPQKINIVIQLKNSLCTLLFFSRLKQLHNSFPALHILLLVNQQICLHIKGAFSLNLGRLKLRLLRNRQILSFIPWYCFVILCIILLRLINAFFNLLHFTMIGLLRFLSFIVNLGWLGCISSPNPCILM
jgi:hypothetical protein